MIHWKAQRRLVELVDGVLSPTEAARVRGHVQGCARCRRLMRELEASEGLLRSLPPSLLPREASAAADARLAALARWAADPEPVWRERFGASAIGAFAAAAGLALVLMSTTWTPLLTEPARAATLSAVVPEAQFAPLGWR
ncbi:MAG: zf-HC2 domain-containing protein [Myxococcota bacterium]